MMRYGKSFKDILNIKQDFFLKDNELHQENLRQAIIYSRQPVRTNCKNCEYPLAEIYFTKHGIHYYLCDRCNHLNGGHKDTEQFVEQLYEKPESDYARYYRAFDREEYVQRVRNIYNPKVEFLANSLRDSGESPETLSYCDIGAGSGHFIYALKKEYGFSNVIGYEVSGEQVQVANNMLEEAVVQKNEMKDIMSIIGETDSSVISMIGVLEHLTNPREILGQISQNPKIRYMYTSLPLFSYSVFFELANQSHFNRHLSGGHTHLYTQDSIRWFCAEFGFEIYSQWNFGADLMDLYRFMLGSLNEYCSSAAMNTFELKFSEIMDDIQLQFDKQNFSSETHILLRKKSE